MTDVNDLPDSPDEIVELPHMFELDLYYMAMNNLRFTLDGIGEKQKELENHIHETEEDEEVVRSLIRTYDTFSNGQRLTAYRMAAVTLVTRFQHWIGTLLKEVGISIVKKRNDPSMLVLQLEALNKSLGVGPIPVRFFDELEEVRNSVIHADSKGEWESPPDKRRRVADHYKDSYGDVEVCSNQLKDAVSKMVEQVKWYESKITAKNSP